MPGSVRFISWGAAVIFSLTSAACGDSDKKSDGTYCPAPNRSVSLDPYPNCAAWLKKGCECPSLQPEAKAACDAQAARGEACAAEDSPLEAWEAACKAAVESGQSACPEDGPICVGSTKIPLAQIPNCKSFEDEQCRCPNLTEGMKNACEWLTGKGYTCLPKDMTPEQFDATCKTMLASGNICPITPGLSKTPWRSIAFPPLDLAFPATY